MRTGNEDRKVEDIKFLKAQLNQQLFMISQPNEKVMKAAWQRWDSIGKPLRSTQGTCHGNIAVQYNRYTKDSTAQTHTGHGCDFIAAQM